MSQFPNDSERLASINAIIQGDMRQLRPWLDNVSEIDDRLTKVEGGNVSSSASVSYDDIGPVTVPSQDARASEVRDGLNELAVAFNLLLAKLKGE